MHSLESCGGLYFRAILFLIFQRFITTQHNITAYFNNALITGAHIPQQIKHEKPKFS